MKEFVRKVLEKGELDVAKLPEFVHDLSVLKGMTNVTAIQITDATTKIQQGKYDIRRACKEYAVLKDIVVHELYGLKGELIYTKIID